MPRQRTDEQGEQQHGQAEELEEARNTETTGRVLQVAEGDHRFIVDLSVSLAHVPFCERTTSDQILLPGHLANLQHC